jgi:formylglycine-generating enzyme required for sulfatase activity
MAGNVWEWCSSWYDESRSLRVFRGGSWSDKPVNLRASIRYWGNVGGRFDFLGFRLVQDIP